MNSPHPEGTESRSGPPTETETDPTDVELSAAVQDAIGRSLKAHYEDIAKAPIPDKLLALLAELEAKETRRGS